MLSWLFTLFLSLNTTLPETQNSPKPEIQIIKLDSSRPYIQAEAGLIADLNSDTILYQKNSFKKLPIASLTKLMTALIIIEEHDLNEIIKVPSQATQTGGSSAYLNSNEEISILNLLKASLIQSGNDAATTLALHNANSTDKFVEKMNLKAKQLNLKSTNFANPIGFDDPNNYSTAQDLYILAKTLYQYPIIQKIVNIESETIYSADKKISHNLTSTNEILNNYLNVSGLKTGTTSLAGGCFIGITKTKTPTIAIVLGSNNRFLDTKTMLDWAQNTFKHQNKNGI